MADKELKMAIQKAIIDFAKEPVHIASIRLFNTLGYNTERQDNFQDKSFKFFKDSFLENNTSFNEEKACVKDWKCIDLLFQLTVDEISKQNGLFDTKQVDNSIIEAYLFFAIELVKSEYSRTQLAQITREINKVFPMPVLIVFKHGNNITLSVINRRLNKKDVRKDVLEKVTVIKDISSISPHRAHIEILYDLSFSELQRIHKFSNFVELHNAWQKTLDTKELNKRFYRDLSNWYFWALQEVHFPTTNWAADRNNLLKKEEVVKEHNAKNLIRLLTRILFVWFVKEKKLIPGELFDETYIKDNLLKGFEPRKTKEFDHKTQGSKYYRAILQNLFFATLNQTMGKREFRKEGQQMNVTNLMRYESYFSDPKLFISLVEDVVPFMNGGLFECLDSPDPVLKGKKGGDVIIYEDGFSDRKDNDLCVPDYIFFGVGEHADLSKELGDKKQKDVTVSGLINILKSYKFTVTENTPIEEDIALDPELLGRVFENLLASYNPETKTTARKQTGSFYTPREIVNYMVDESLKAYLKQKLETEAGMKPEDAETSLEFLIGYNEKEHLFDEKQITVLINAIDSCKILDPACGSGAFPMGILHKLVYILHKLDPQNNLWKERQIEKARTIDDAGIIEKTIDDIETAFESNELDYGRKLYLIENCIYGVDIQPIATQISKLRFFISLIVDQNADKKKENFGIRPLPNLETKFIAANTLIGIKKPKVGDFVGNFFDNKEVKKLEKNLKDVRHQLFSAKTPSKKRKLREEDQQIREEMSRILEDAGWSNESSRQLAAWDPYNQNVSSGWFDPEWMFWIAEGFDIVIGNPPYIVTKKGKYNGYQWDGDLYTMFFELSVKYLLKKGGVLSFITPRFFLFNQSNFNMRHHILNELNILGMVECNPFDAVTENEITILTIDKAKSKKIDFYLQENGNMKYFNSVQKEWIRNNRFLEINPYLTKPVFLILQKIANNKSKLSDIVISKRGAEIGKSELRKSKRGKNILLGYDVSRFCVSPNDAKIDTSHKEYQRLKEFFKQPIILLLRRVSKDLIAAVCNNPIAFSKNLYGIIPDERINPYFLAGILNSNLLNFYYKKKFSTKKEDVFPEIQTYLYEQLPVKIINKMDQKVLISLVEKIHTAKEKNPRVDTSGLEKQLNRIVYKIYELTDEEIAIVEDSVK